jgi:hypothetical protein
MKSRMSLDAEQPLAKIEKGRVEVGITSEVPSQEGSILAAERSSQVTVERSVTVLEESTSDSSESPQHAEAIDLADVREVVCAHFPGLWHAVKAALATCATLLLADSTNPVALILVGPPSAGKTTVTSMFDGATVNGQEICYRSDKFTPASFVSQSAQATEATLKKVDLLPKIRFKVLLTPELGTMFRGKHDELVERFSVLTRVLDGQGLTTDSGTHGRRGYEGDYFFAWVGCTTPFSAGVWKVMAQLGSRLFFLVLDAESEPTVDELVASLKYPISYKDALKACAFVVQSFLEELFEKHGGVRGVEWDTERSPDDVVQVIAQCASLLALLRSPYDSENQVQAESPRRANAVLHNLARGHALISGRAHLIREDLSLVVRVTFSSIPEKRRATLLALIQHGGHASVREVSAATGLTQHPAEDIMREMQWLGLCTFHQPGQGKASSLSLGTDWAWILRDEFRDLLEEGHLAVSRGCA